MNASGLQASSLVRADTRSLCALKPLRYTDADRKPVHAKRLPRPPPVVMAKTPAVAGSATAHGTTSQRGCKDDSSLLWVTETSWVSRVDQVEVNSELRVAAAAMIHFLVQGDLQGWSPSRVRALGPLGIPITWSLDA